MRPINAINAILLCLGSFTRAQAPPPYNPSPWNGAGLITVLTIDGTSTEPLRGGSFTLGQTVVKVPANFLVDVTCQAVSWVDFVNGVGSNPVHAEVLANRVGDGYVAGLMAATGNEPNKVTSGFINFIDIPNSMFRVGGPMGVDAGEMVKLNDPVGRYGVKQTGFALFTSDADNPSITAITGYPLCLPRPGLPDDPLCPQANRPKDAAGVPLKTFTMPAPPAAGATTTGPDSRKTAPLQVGDYVTVSGVIASGVTASGVTVGGILWASVLSANLGIYTAAGTKPAYYIVETAQFGIGVPAAGNEIAFSRVVGFSTDISTSLTIYALDPDPCTGAPVERRIIGASPDPMTVKGRWRWSDQGSVKTPPARQVLVRSNTGTMITDNGILSGEYTFPVPFAGMIYPENTVFGANLPQWTFGTVPWLSQSASNVYSGSPSLGTALTTPIKVGPLTPAAGIYTLPAAPVCPLPGTIVPVPPTTPAATPAIPAALSTWHDSIKILTATSKNQRGAATITVTVSWAWIVPSPLTEAKPAQPVVMCIPDNAAAQPMIFDAVTGGYSVSFAAKARPNSITVKSDYSLAPFAFTTTIL